jgi:hypothetical protein
LEKLVPSITLLLIFTNYHAMHKIRFLRIQFQPGIAAAELPRFRGAIAAAVGPEHLLFHNHLGDGQLRYAYPLIQYKRMQGKPVLVCLNEGTDEIHALFQQHIRTLQLGERSVELQVEAIELREWPLEVSPRFFQHRINNWLALSGENYQRYRTLPDEGARYAFLSQILRGNLLAMAKGLDWYIQSEVLVALHDLSGPRPVRYKDATLMAFDAHFSSNISLPYSIGLGKGAARGFGVVFPKSKTSNSNYEERDNLFSGTTP